MALCPFAEIRLLPDNRTQPISGGQRLFIAHSIVGSAEGAYGYFLRSTALESHFIIKLDGRIIQCIDTARTADANYLANNFAISAETEDNGRPDTFPWTPAQEYSLIRLGVWARQAHPEIADKPATTWNGSGYGYHSQFPGKWTNVSGKTCPGVIRVHQFKTIILPGILRGLAAIEGESVADQPSQIIWYQKISPITRKASNHAYCRYALSGHAKWLDETGLNLLRFLEIPENPTVLNKDFQRNTIIVDGPCKNV